MTDETVQLLIDTILTVGDSMGLPPNVALIVLVVSLVGLGVALFWFRLKPASLVVQALVALIHGVIRRRRMAPKSTLSPLQVERAPSIRLPPPELPPLQKTVRPDPED